MPSAILRAKCVIAGDSAVGKTALTQVFYSDGAHFPKNYNMTAGVDLLVKRINIPESEYSVEMFIYDSAGKDVYSDMNVKCWKDASVVILIYDISNEQSFKNAKSWLQKLKESQGPEYSIHGVLVANKLDLVERRCVSHKDGTDLANSLGLEYMETSAKDHTNCEAPFYYVANQVYEMFNKKSGFSMKLA